MAKHYNVERQARLMNGRARMCYSCEFYQICLRSHLDKLCSRHYVAGFKAGVKWFKKVSNEKDINAQEE